MTDEQRVEAAARVLCRYLHLRIPADDELQIYMPAAREMLAASYPELHGDKSSHWLAPNEADDVMVAFGGSAFDYPSVYMGGPSHAGKRMAKTLFTAMRTTHLAKDQK